MMRRASVDHRLHLRTPPFRYSRHTSPFVRLSPSAVSMGRVHTRHSCCKPILPPPPARAVAAPAQGPLRTCRRPRQHCACRSRPARCAHAAVLCTTAQSVQRHAARKQRVRHKPNNVCDTRARLFDEPLLDQTDWPECTAAQADAFLAVVVGTAVSSTCAATE
jgi:hypothetical protein